MFQTWQRVEQDPLPPLPLQLLLRSQDTNTPYMAWQLKGTGRRQVGM